MTKARRAILDVLEQAHEPISVADLSKKLADFCDPATVYRNVRYLENKNLATSFILHCSEHGTMRYYTAYEHHHWFHCEQCHCFIDLGTCAFEREMKQFEKEHGFTVRDHTFYLTGMCQNCSLALGV